MTEHARRTEKNGVITITFDRQDKLNATSREMLEVLERAIYDLRDDDAHRVLVITAVGKFFTSGMDIGTMGGERGVGTDGVKRGSNMRRDYRLQGRHDVWDEIERVEKPVILAAQGPCIGIGMEIASSCDFRFASERTWFSLPEIQNLAVIAGSGGISRLTRIVGPHWSKWFSMAGERVNAEDARMMGFVHQIIPEPEFHDHVQQFAEKLAGFPGEAVGITKILIDSVPGSDRRAARDWDRLAQNLMFDSPDHKSKVDDFMNKSKGS